MKKNEILWYTCCAYIPYYSQWILNLKEFGLTFYDSISELVGYTFDFKLSVKN
jgi:hypothetical protein